ncbi:protein DJ-1 homolog B [Cyclospora cayetanensis]|uniref:Protein DJ-1 homolog B n=1 Tax=Cyclospora cayetanensis TaxID=88456 RepID=A0A6P6S4L1_9EIME|nr:protein DJ-1 homolog B [Cyclospora cayetanensis]
MLGGDSPSLQHEHLEEQWENAAAVFGKAHIRLFKKILTDKSQQKAVRGHAVRYTLLAWGLRTAVCTAVFGGCASLGSSGDWGCEFSECLEVAAAHTVAFPLPALGKIVKKAACVPLVERAHPCFLSSHDSGVASCSTSFPVLVECKKRKVAHSVVATHFPPRSFATVVPQARGTQHSKGQLHHSTAHKMPKTALVALANGAEDIEFITPVDVLRRAGFKVVVASVGNHMAVKTAQGVHIEGEVLLKDIPESKHFDVIVIPGGSKGAENCRDCPHLTQLLKAQHAAGRWIASICASPAVVLAHHGILDDHKAVAYPSFQNELKHKGKGRVCVDKHIITSMGPGSALEFSMEIVNCLLGEAKRDELMKGMCVV